MLNVKSLYHSMTELSTSLLYVSVCDHDLYRHKCPDRILGVLTGFGAMYIVSSCFDHLLLGNFFDKSEIGKTSEKTKGNFHSFIHFVLALYTS